VPQPVDRDIVVELPKLCELRLRVTSKAGRKLDHIAVEVLPGRLDDDKVGLRRMGVLRPLQIGKRLVRESGRRWRLRDLQCGRYVVAVSAPEHAMALREVELQQDQKGQEKQENQVEFELDLAVRYPILVTNSGGRPVSHAAVHARPSDRSQLLAVTHVHCGFTDREGRMTITRVQADKINVAVSHPAYGMVDATLERDLGEHRVVLADPGSIQGTVFAKGQVPEPGKWSIMLTGRPTNGENIMRDTPRFAAVGRGGIFVFGSLQPGYYELRAVESKNMATSFAGWIELFKDVDGYDQTTVEVVAGRVAQATVRVAGASGDLNNTLQRLSGTVRINGKPGQNLRLKLSTNRGKKLAEVFTDGSGFFDFGPVTAGLRWVSVHPGAGAGAKNTAAIYGTNLRVHPAQSETLEIDFTTTTLSGTVVDQQGKPVFRAVVIAVRQPGGSGGFLYLHTRTDAKGCFELEHVIGGEYLVMRAGKPVDLRFELRRSLRVRGRIDLAAHSLGDAGIMTLEAYRETRLAQNSVSLTTAASTRVRADGSFEFAGLEAGVYRFDLTSDKGHKLSHEGKLEVKDSDVDDLVLKLVKTKWAR
jgi:hypothetical protein